ncbi:MAG: AAA family ATPase [Ignavibacteriales bacterium CG_4_9_14_3_um_filter_30_11]|nr:MAG: AAA family ATPase [Ignavibacteriales bacterium CG_4_9_14_3_um_filter_30_11]
MFMEELFYRYNPWWEEDFTLSEIIDRPDEIEKLEKYLEQKSIVFLTGLRRVGKTTLMKMLIKKMIDEHNIDPVVIFYISLDDYNLSKKTILEIVEEYRKIHKIAFKEKSYLFFDEVTYGKDYELQLKNLYDAQNVKIFVSSSSASILKSKKPFLTGRNNLIEILPLNFSEYLSFKKIKIARSDSHLIDKYFEDYLNTGGIPEYVLKNDVEYLKELVDDIIKKDIASFYNIKSTQILQDYFLLLMERAGKNLSINKAANILSISPDSAKRYLQMFADSYLIYLLPRYGKTNERLLSPKKIYAPDLGIRTLFTGFRDKGSLFENYVYLNIKNLDPSYIYINSIELDFMTKGKELIEVKYHSEMTGKQKEIFDTTPARKKHLIKNYSDLELLLDALSK